MALKAQQSQLFMTNDDSPETFDAIEEVRNLSGPDGTANLIDTTHLTSQGKEYLSGLADWGKIQLDCNFTGGDKQMDLRDKYSSQAPAHNYVFVIPDDATPTTYHKFAFSAIVLSWSLNTPTDDRVSLSVSIQVSGAVVYTSKQSLPT